MYIVILKISEKKKKKKIGKNYLTGTPAGVYIVTHPAILDSLIGSKMDPFKF